MLSLRATCCLLIMPAAVLLITGSMPPSFSLTTAAVAQPTGDAAEKEAFEGAKELGTADAWRAFLKNFQTGFRADLARAYLKKLDGGQAAAPPTTPNSVTAAAEPISCKQAHQLKSKNSVTAARITFINKSGAMRVIQWKTFDGGYKDYGTLEPGQELVQDTFLTHPWIVANGPGDCAQAFLPVPGSSIAILDVTNEQVAERVGDDDGDNSGASSKKSSKKQRDAESDHGPTPEQSCRDIGQVYYEGTCVQKKSKKKAEKSARKSCAELDMDYRNGQCVAKYKKDKERLKKQKKKGCPPGTYLNQLGVCQGNETGG